MFLNPLDSHVKFCANQMLYLLYDLEIYFLCIILDCKKLQFKQLMDDIIIDTWFFWNFVNIKDIRNKCNSIVDLSKFTFNKKILSDVVTLGYN